MPSPGDKPGLCPLSARDVPFACAGFLYVFKGAAFGRAGAGLRAAAARPSSPAPTRLGRSQLEQQKPRSPVRGLRALPAA